MAKILLADDDFTMVNLLRTLLGMEGYQVVSVLDKPGDLVENIRREKADCLMIDIFLGRMNGLDVVRQVRRDRGLDYLRILIASGSDQSIESIAAGADDFLQKPYMPDELYEKLVKLLAMPPHGTPTGIPSATGTHGRSGD